MKNYKELDVWMASRKFVKAFYGLMLSFLNRDRYSLISPINRNVISLPSEILEGIGRPSDKDTVQFTDIAKDYLDIVLKENISHQKSLNGFINYFKNKK